MSSEYPATTASLLNEIDCVIEDLALYGIPLVARNAAQLMAGYSDATIVADGLDALSYFIRTYDMASTTTYSHQTMTRNCFSTYVTEMFGERSERGLILRGYYDHVEYVSAPDGLVVLAHRPHSGQVDGIHPATLSKHVQTSANIIEPLSGPDSGYAVHYLTGNQHWSALGAFGRMIHPGTREAPSFKREHGAFTLEIFNAPSGPVVAVMEEVDKVHVIAPTIGAMAEKVAA